MDKSEDVQNMPCWYYEKADLKKTPSFYDGINSETEARYRREGPRFIFDMGTRLGLHHDTIATGIVFFHRFYMFHSFKKFPRHITATCCLFLAGKVEETPKKCKDLIKVARSLLNEAQFAQFAEDPKEEVLTFEKVLLQTIKFDLTVEHPYKYMLQYAKGLKGERSKIEQLVQMSWTFINDSLCTSLCLQWEPQIVAVAVMYLAGRLCKFEPQDWAYNRGRWWEQFIDDISMDLLEDICHQVLDQYSHAKGGKAGSSSKAKRDRPKTPGDGEKGSEPQAKMSKSDSHKSSQKPKSTQAPHSSQKPHTPRTTEIKTSGNKNQSSNRRGSSNTEVVAMDTVDTADRGAIEQGKPPAQSAAVTTAATTTTAATSKTQTPTKSAPTEQSTYYSGINQYQSFIGSTDPSTLGFMQQGQYSQFPSNFPAVPLTPQTPPIRQPFPAAGASQQNFPNFSNFHGNHVPHTPPNETALYQPGQNNFPSNYGTQSSTGLATVRITGRREQQGGGGQWS